MLVEDADLYKQTRSGGTTGLCDATSLLVLLRVSEILICNNLCNKRGEMNLVSSLQMSIFLVESI
jgi:hypothetical protein